MKRKGKKKEEEAESRIRKSSSTIDDAESNALKHRYSPFSFGSVSRLSPVSFLVSIFGRNFLKQIKYIESN